MLPNDVTYRKSKKFKLKKKDILGELSLIYVLTRLLTGECNNKHNFLNRFLLWTNHKVESSLLFIEVGICLYFGRKKYCLGTLTRHLWNHLPNFEIGKLECHVITIEYRTHVHGIHMKHLCGNALVHVIYSVNISGQYVYTIISRVCCVDIISSSN